MDTLALVLVGLVVAYLGWCWVFPYNRCWRCRGRETAGDGRGNYRIRRPCLVCGGQPHRRLGARLLGRG